jgi:hypothetical protein
MSGDDLPALPGPFRDLARESSASRSESLQPMISRIGQDAAHVSVHDGDAAAKACELINARAFTYGRHIVFGRGEYQPGTASGKLLIAHELSHVEQQATSGLRRLDRQPHTPLPAPFYGPLLDAIRREQRDNPRGRDLQILRKLESLASAVEGGDKQGTQSAASDFLKAVRRAEMTYSTSLELNEVPLTIVSRVFMLGLSKEAAALQQHFFGKEGQPQYDQPAWRPGFPTDYAVAERIVSDAIAGVTALDASHAETNIDRLLRGFTRVTESLSRLDYKEVSKIEERSRTDAGSSLELIEAIGRNPDSDVANHFSHLLSLLPPIVELIQRSFQPVMDAARADLEAGKSDVMLRKAADILEKRLSAPFRAASGTQLAPYLSRILSVDVNVTRSKFEGRYKKHLDFFDRTKRSPWIEITSYDKTETNFSEKQLSLLRILEIRAGQIRFLQQMFGFARDKKGAITADSAENAAALKTMSGFKLDDNDSWRTFLLEKFNASKKRLGQDWLALLATTDMLKAYFGAFTFHTPYNIDEFGDNYLSRTFPRALTGQLIHDCGVYALRAAYALSLVRDKLGLKFRAIVLPVHVALVISFHDPAQGVFIVNNDDIVHLDPASAKTQNVEYSTRTSQGAQDEGSKIQEFIRRWTEGDESGGQRKSARPLDAAKFLAELAAASFMERVDVPYRVTNVPQVPNVKSVAKRKSVLWDFYHSDIVKYKKRTGDVLVSTTEEPQPVLRFLQLLEDEKRMINQLGVPFWRRANVLFTTNRMALLQAAGQRRSSDARQRAAANTVLQNHDKQLLALAKPLLESASQLDRERAEVSEMLHAHPDVIAKSATVSHWRVLNVSLQWDDLLDALSDYIGDGATTGALLHGAVTPAPWEDEEKLPRPVD